MKKYTVDPVYNGYKIKDFLREMGHSGRSLKRSQVFLNGKRVRLDKKIKKLNVVRIVENEKESGLEAIKMDLDILHEDNNLLILNKPPYLIVHPTKKKVDKTLANGILYYLMEKTGKKTVPRLVNRLDMNTSGIIVAAKNSSTQNFLQEGSKMKKVYRALVEGDIVEDDFTIDTPIGRIGDNLRREPLKVEDGGQEAKSICRVIDRYDDMTYVEVELVTGRTHQIRAHFASIGHPLIGDELYGGRLDETKRQQLHSYKLILKEPENKKDLEIICEIPEDMEGFLKKS